MAQEKVKFIRKNGRVIPIKSKGSGTDNNRHKQGFGKRKGQKDNFFKGESEKNTSVIKANAAFDRSTKRIRKKEKFSIMGAVTGAITGAALFRNKGKAALIGGLLGGIGLTSSKETTASKNLRSNARSKFIKHSKKARSLGATNDDFSDSQNQKAGRRFNQKFHSSSV